MSNDLSRGLFPADQVKLLVVDEAHRAQGDYAYCQVFIIFVFKKKKFLTKMAQVCRPCSFYLNFNKPTNINCPYIKQMNRGYYSFLHNRVCISPR